MKVKPKRILAGLAAALALTVTTALAGPVAPRAAADDPAAVMKVAITTDIDTFNPFQAILASSTAILRFQYESLVTWGTNNETVPGLADKWETSPDGKTWTFHIPEDRKWSDGKPLTAEDAAWTFNAIKNDNKLQQANGGLVENVASVNVKDPQTLEIVLTAPQAANPGGELPIVPKHVWETVDAATYENDTDTVGSGPYTIKSYTQSQSVQLVANPNFWRGAAKLSGLTWVYYKNGDAAVQALKTGEVDIVSGLTAAQFESLKTEQGISTVTGAGRRYSSIAINPGTIDAEGKPMGDGHPALKDPVLRKAIMMAIDRETLFDRVLHGLGKLGETEMPTVYPQYYGFAPGTEAYPYDAAAANKALDDAGYAKGPDGIRLDKEGKPLKLRLMGRNTEPSHQLIADFLKPWLKEIGVEITVSMVTPQQVNDDSTLGKYDLYFTGWGIGPDPDFQLSINQCNSRPNADGSGNTSENNWCDPEFDKLYQAQHTEQDPAKRGEIVKQAFSMIHESGVNMVLWYADSLEAYRSDKFTGFIRQPEGQGPITGQNSYWGLYSATPVAAEGEPGAPGATGGGVPGWAIGVGIAVLVVIAGGAVLLVLRGRRTADDRE
ncbi:ABC transporter substrate-binding protein [Microlunatus sp. GCM10028923]|uniref:ABC transporter substrate-binding protein n=1 Tax=Microlunatus sp. GCM10028923 TaxID=3273400 RepID=UPI00360AE035